MTGVYIEETLKSLIKPHIIDLFLKIKEHTNTKISKLTDKIRNLYANFKRLESDVEVCKKVSDALVKHVASTLEKYIIIPKGVCRDNKHT